MGSSTLMLIGGILAGGLLLLVLWRAMRLVMRFVLIGVLLLLLGAGALLWWYGYGAAPAPSSREGHSPAGVRRNPGR